MPTTPILPAMPRMPTPTQTQILILVPTCQTTTFVFPLSRASIFGIIPPSNTTRPPHPTSPPTPPSTSPRTSTGPVPPTIQARPLHRPATARPLRPLVTRHLRRRPRHRRPPTFTVSSRFRARVPPRPSSNTTMTPPLGSNSTRTAPTNRSRLIHKPRPRPSRPPLPARLLSCPRPSIHPPLPPRARLHFLPLPKNIVRLIPLPLRLRSPQMLPIRTPLPIPLLPLPPPPRINHTTLLPHPPLPPLLLPLLLHLMLPLRLMLTLHTPLTNHIQPRHLHIHTHPLPPLQHRLSHPNRTPTHTLPITSPLLLPLLLIHSTIPGRVRRTRTRQLHRFADILKSRTRGT